MSFRDAGSVPAALELGHERLGDVVEAVRRIRGPQHQAVAAPIGTP